MYICSQCVHFYFNYFNIIYNIIAVDQGRLNALTTDHEGGGGAEGILCGVMKLKNPIFIKGREYENALPAKF